MRRAKAAVILRSSLQLMPVKARLSPSIVRRQRFVGRYLFCFPCGFHPRACLAVLVFSLRPNLPQSLLQICIFLFSYPVDLRPVVLENSSEPGIYKVFLARGGFGRSRSVLETQRSIELTVVLKMRSLVFLPITLDLKRWIQTGEGSSCLPGGYYCCQSHHPCSSCFLAICYWFSIQTHTFVTPSHS